MAFVAGAVLWRRASGVTGTLKRLRAFRHRFLTIFCPGRLVSRPVALRCRGPSPIVLVCLVAPTFTVHGDSQSSNRRLGTF